MSGIELDSKVNMKEFLIAILEDNSKNERTIGLSDADIIEVLEQSVEIMALTEEVSLKFSRLTNISVISDGQKSHVYRHLQLHDLESEGEQR